MRVQLLRKGTLPNSNTANVVQPVQIQSLSSLVPKARGDPLMHLPLLFVQQLQAFVFVR